MKTINCYKIFISAGLVLVLSACSNSDSKEAVKPGPQGLTCSLEGHWESCSNNGASDSSKVVLQVVGNTLYEVVENYNTSNDCTGTPASQFSFNADLTIGEIGASAIAGGTDVDLVPDVDFAGCGSGQPVYTAIKFSDDCKQFQSADTVPSCDPSTRGTSFGLQNFVKQ